MKSKNSSVEGTVRLEAFSDAVIAIVMTLLVLEIRVPEIHEMTSAHALTALMPVIPKLLVFFLSFITVAIFWVNHHHFFHPIEKSDGTLLWHNNHLLFWLAVVPFATALIGDYPTIPLVVAIYGFVLCMAALAFTLMARYVFFHSTLLPHTIGSKTRTSEFRRALIGVVVYGIAVATAFLHPAIALAIFVIVPLYYFLPHRIADESAN